MEVPRLSRLNNAGVARLKFVPGHTIETGFLPLGSVAAPKSMSNGRTGNRPAPPPKSALEFPEFRRSCSDGQVRSGKVQVVLTGSRCAANAGSLRADLH